MNKIVTSKYCQQKTNETIDKRSMDNDQNDNWRRIICKTNSPHHTTLDKLILVPQHNDIHQPQPERRIKIPRCYFAHRCLLNFVILESNAKMLQFWMITLSKFGHKLDVVHCSSDFEKIEGRKQSWKHPPAKLNQLIQVSTH